MEKWSTGGNVGSHHQPVIFGDAGLCKSLVLFQFPAERLAVQPVGHRTSVRAGDGEFQRGGQFGEQFLDGDIIG